MGFFSRARSVFNNYRHALFFLLFIGVYTGYFFLQQLRPPVYFIKITLDDWIPFCEWFVIPYVFWYAYISLPMIYLFFRYRDDFIRMALYLFSGIAVSFVIFALFPSGIDFRPTVFTRSNILIDIVKQIYIADKPTNVCPSLHVYESVVVHISLCKSKMMKGHKIRIYASLTAVILICLSTMFIKQHSAVDVLCGLLLALPMYCLVFRFDSIKKFLNKNAALINKKLRRQVD